VEEVLWRRLSIGAGIMAFVALACSIGQALNVGLREGFLAIALGPVVGFPYLFAGFARWNRYPTVAADPEDSLNGTSALLAAVALISVVDLHIGGLPASLEWWQRQAVLAQSAAVLVLLVTVALAAVAGGLARDRRPWAIVTALLVGLGANGCVVTGWLSLRWLFLPWVLMGVALCIVAGMPPSAGQTRAASPVASTVGAFVIILAVLAVLGVNAIAPIGVVATCCAVLAGAGAAVRLLVNVRDLARLRVSRHEALTDDLTGLPNRRAVLALLDTLCARSATALAILDLDRFKEVNDGLGHACGDELLRLVAQRLDASLRQGEVVGRLGGDEFAIIATWDARDANVPEEWAYALGFRAFEALSLPFLVSGLSLHTTASIGVTTNLGPNGVTVFEPSPAELLRRADAAMYDAKRSGVPIAEYDSVRHPDNRASVVLVEELRTALATGQLVLYYQPQVDLSSNEVKGVEALVRWRHPARGLLSPAEFLPLAEAYGLIGRLTEQVLAQAVAQAAAWQAQGLAMRVSVNLSASNLLDAGLPQRLAELLSAHGLPSSAIELEVTESVLMVHPDRSHAVVRGLAGLGATISIDDFGTGFASLTYLRELPVCELKLDRSFTADLVSDARTGEIVASTVRLAHALGLRVVAEGVEDLSTLAQLRSLGCDESQGYFHAPPLPARDLEQWLARRGILMAPAT
jgi:diguanylate cyclase (GGDEF)-like protein